MSAGTYLLSTEINCDLPLSYYKEHDVFLFSMTYTIDDCEYDVLDPKTPSLPEFYQQIAAGAMPRTSQIPVVKFAENFEKIVKTGKDILHISFSSGLSGTYQSACIAAEEVMEKYPDRRIVVIDSLAASMGMGLLLHYAVKKRDSGASIDELAAYVKETVPHVCHDFTVNDLFHLHRGGRVSKTTAIFGSALNIKPLLHVDDEGKLISVGKVRGRKASLNWLIDQTAEKCVALENETIFISHAASPDDAQYVADQIHARTGKEILIGEIGQVIGSHSGIGTVAVFFLGESKAV